MAAGVLLPKVWFTGVDTTGLLILDSGVRGAWKRKGDNFL